LTSAPFKHTFLISKIVKFEQHWFNEHPSAVLLAIQLRRFDLHCVSEHCSSKLFKERLLWLQVQLSGLTKAKVLVLLHRKTAARIFAHFSGIVGDGFRTLNEGQRVSFTATQSEKGPQASEITPI